MTCIAWDGKILAADRMCSTNGYTYEKQKLIEVTRQSSGLKYAVAWTGNECGYLSVFDWWNKGAAPEDFPAIQASDHGATMIVLRLEDTSTKAPVFYDRSPFPHSVEPNQARAWGCAAQIAMGAMWMGATAPQAVRAANDLDSDCGYGVDAAYRGET